MEQVQSVPHGLALKPGSLRVLRWLERYPFQRAQDLLVALAPFERRTVVYERLAALERQQLIEALRPGIAQGKKVYHLSPLGTYACDHLTTSSLGERQARWHHLGTAQVVREEREKLVRLLPRLPVFLLMQDLVNGLVLHASAALTQQGRRASVTQWNWQRDFAHTFLGPREKRLRLRVEGALTFCLRYLSGEEARPTSDGRSLEEHWYTPLLLHCPLEEIRLIRLRLDRLLRWRESVERAVVYSQMPPLLILATSERQAEWWHLMALQVAAQLRVECPLGALASLPQSVDALADGWRLSWRKLGTKEHCHLQELFRPLRQTAVPALLTGRGSASARAHVVGEQEQGHRLTLPARLHTHAYALGGRAGEKQRAVARTKRPENGLRDYRLGSLNLTPRHWEMLLLCFAHPFLSRDDYVLLLALSHTSINLLLADLSRWGYLVEVTTLVGERWQLAEDGLLLLARLALCHVQRLVRLPVGDECPLQQRGAPGLLHQIRHTAGVYGFFAELCAQLSTHPDVHVRWFETGPSSEWHFRYADKTYRFRPDALAAVQVGEHTFRFWLEWDRGTMDAHDLEKKFATYGMYLISREWARSSPYLPALLCVAPEMGQERRLAEAASTCLVKVPAAFRIYTTTAYLLAREGILADIWQQVVLAHQQALAPGKRRVALFGEEARTIG